MTDPELIFIVPYRNRQDHLDFFKKHMNYILEDYTNYKIFYIHQNDNRNFNRGALKNIGFIIVKEMYPNSYKNITLVFNDVDTMPISKNMLNYDTTKNIVKHFYGFKHTLGGIVSIKGVDFESVNGFPNFWSWGYEDNVLNKRIENKNIKIDRSVFFHIRDKNIIQLNESTYRTVNETEYSLFKKKTYEGITNITNLTYNINYETNFIDVNTFDTGRTARTDKDKQYDLKNGNYPFKKKTMKMNFY